MQNCEDRHDDQDHGRSRNANRFRAQGRLSTVRCIDDLSMGGLKMLPHIELHIPEAIFEESSRHSER